MDKTYTHPNGYSAKLYGESSMSIYYEGKEVMHTGFRSVNTEDEVMKLLADQPRLMEEFKEEARQREHKKFGRLIDADKLRDDFNDILAVIEKDKTRESISKEEFCMCLEILRECTDEQPTAYKVDAVVAELCKEANDTTVDFCNGVFVNVESAIDIVKRGGVE